MELTHSESNWQRETCVVEESSAARTSKQAARTHRYLSTGRQSMHLVMSSMHFLQVMQEWPGTCSTLRLRCGSATIRTTRSTWDVASSHFKNFVTLSNDTSTNDRRITFLSLVRVSSFQMINDSSCYLAPCLRDLARWSKSQAVKMYCWYNWSCMTHHNHIHISMTSLIQVSIIQEDIVDMLRNGKRFFTSLEASLQHSVNLVMFGVFCIRTDAFGLDIFLPWCFHELGDSSSSTIWRKECAEYFLSLRDMDVQSWQVQSVLHGYPIERNEVLWCRIFVRESSHIEFSCSFSVQFDEFPDEGSGKFKQRVDKHGLKPDSLLLRAGVFRVLLHCSHASSNFFVNTIERQLPIRYGRRSSLSAMLKIVGMGICSTESDTVLFGVFVTLSSHDFLRIRDGLCTLKC